MQRDSCKSIIIPERNYQMTAVLELLSDLLEFLRARRKYWLAPLILALVSMGALLIFAKGSVVAPFIYSLF